MQCHLSVSKLKGVSRGTSITVRGDGVHRNGGHDIRTMMDTHGRLKLSFSSPRKLHFLTSPTNLNSTLEGGNSRYQCIAK